MNELFHRTYGVVAGLANPLPNVEAGTNQLQDILNIVFAISGAIAVLIIVLAGFKYITSGSDPGAVSTAKNAIIYALVGLVVIMFAFAIVNFVIAGVS
jgi:hypothetical protein